MEGTLEETRKKAEARLQYVSDRYGQELKANEKRQEYMQKMEDHFKKIKNDKDKLEKLVVRIGEFIDKLKQDAPSKKVQITAQSKEIKDVAPSALKKREQKKEDKTKEKSKKTV